MSRVEDIAAKLTEAQRRALCAIVDAGSNPYGHTPSELGANGRAMQALAEKGLVTGGRVYGGPLSYIATDLGRAVRDHLRAQQEKEG